MTCLELLNTIEPWINQLCRKVPYQWREDITQELKLYTIINYDMAKGNINFTILRKNLLNQYKRFNKSEYSKGVTYINDKILPEDIFIRLKYEYYDIKCDRRKLENIPMQ